MKILKFHVLLTICVLSLGTLVLFQNCGGSGGGGATSSGGRSANVSLHITSANLGAPAQLNSASAQLPKVSSLSVNEASSEPDFNHPPDMSIYSPYINSGYPDYVKITVTQIAIQGDWGEDILWSGSKELTISGGSVDVSDITADFQKIHTGTATMIRATFLSQAKIKGTLSGIFNPAPSGFTQSNLTVYTKAAYAYNAVTHTGGADSPTSFETAPAEEMDFSIGAFGDTITIQTPCNTVIDQTPATLTLLFDLNRLLRFYDGQNTTHDGGPFPTDPNDKAYFFGHSFLGSFIAPFFGTPGSIEGYKTAYSAANPSTPGQYMLVNGWMTLVFDADGKFLSGMLMGDDDNAFTVAKGFVTSFTDGTSFSYDISKGVVSGFSRIGTVGNWSFPVPTFQTTNMISSGDAQFQLLLKE